MSIAWLTNLKPPVIGEMGGNPYPGREDKALKKEMSLLWQEEAKGSL